MVPKSLEMSSGPKYSFFKSHLTKPVPLPKDISLAGKTAIITGGNIGIGLACADMMLEMKVGRLIIAVRTPARGEAAAERLRQKYKRANIEVWLVDMLTYKSVQGFAARCASLDRLDIVILNAGVNEPVFKLSPEGHQTGYQVNYLSTVLLATLLLPVLRSKTPGHEPGRLTIVNSGAAHQTNVTDWSPDPILANLFDDEHNFLGMETYSRSKLVAHFWIVRLAEWVSADDVVVNLVDPGLVKGTGLARDAPWYILLMYQAARAAIGRTVQQAATLLIDAAVVKGKESHGSYLQDWGVFPYVPIVYTPEGKTVGERIWKETLDELKFANIEGILESMRR